MMLLLFEIESSSGNANPNYKNYIPASHVEGKSAIYMRENGINNGTVFHNNTYGTCPYCDKMLPTLLEEGSTLMVVPPANEMVWIVGIFKSATWRLFRKMFRTYYFHSE